MSEELTQSEHNVIIQFYFLPKPESISRKVVRYHFQKPDNFALLWVHRQPLASAVFNLEDPSSFSTNSKTPVLIGIKFHVRKFPPTTQKILPPRTFAWLSALPSVWGSESFSGIISVNRQHTIPCKFLVQPESNSELFTKHISIPVLFGSRP